MSEKKSVSAFRVLKSSIIEMKNDPLMYSIFLFPIYLLTLVSYSSDEFIIVYNQDFASYKYSLNSYLTRLLYALIESYIFAIIAVSIHNKIIKKYNFTLFSKGIIIYAVFYLANHAEFLGYLIYDNFIISFAIISKFSILFYPLIFYFTSFCGYYIFPIFLLMTIVVFFTFLKILMEQD